LTSAVLHRRGQRIGKFQSVKVKLYLLVTNYMQVIALALEIQLEIRLELDLFKGLEALDSGAARAKAEI